MQVKLDQSEQPGSERTYICKLRRPVAGTQIKQYQKR